MDLVLTSGLSTYSYAGPVQLLLNQGNDAHWLQLKLVGRQSNSLGIGARVELVTSDGLRQIREQNGGVHHFSQNEMILSFGLGQRDRISSLTIRWPSGLVQKLTNVAIDRRLTIVEGQSSATPTPTSTPTGTPPPELALKGYWKLDETGGQRADSSASLYHLTDHNTVASQAGRLGRAADFERGQKE